MGVNPQARSLTGSQSSICAIEHDSHRAVVVNLDVHVCLEAARFHPQTAFPEPRQGRLE